MKLQLPSLTTFPKFSVWTFREKWVRFVVGSTAVLLFFPTLTCHKFLMLKLEEPRNKHSISKNLKVMNNYVTQIKICLFFWEIYLQWLSIILNQFKALKSDIFVNLKLNCQLLRAALNKPKIWGRWSKYVFFRDSDHSILQQLQQK